LMTQSVNTGHGAWHYLCQDGVWSTTRCNSVLVRYGEPNHEGPTLRPSKWLRRMDQAGLGPRETCLNSSWKYWAWVSLWASNQGQGGCISGNFRGKQAAHKTC
jgi:hypothetical protein